jgi:hypothetical protein
LIRVRCRAAANPFATEREREKKDSQQKSRLWVFPASARNLQGPWMNRIYFRCESLESLFLVVDEETVRKRSRRKSRLPPPATPKSLFPRLLFSTTSLPQGPIQSCCCKHPAKEYSLTTGVK